MCSDQAHTSTSTVSQKLIATEQVQQDISGNPDALQADGLEATQATSLQAAIGTLGRVTRANTSMPLWGRQLCGSNVCLERDLQAGSSECNGILVCLVIVQKIE